MDDPFGNMREQMERERDNFFKTVNPRDWPSDSSARGGMFNRVSIYFIILTKSDMTFDKFSITWT